MHTLHFSPAMNDVIEDKMICFQEKYCIISSLDSHIYRGEIGSVKEKCYHCDATQDVSNLEATSLRKN